MSSQVAELATAGQQLLTVARKQRFDILALEAQVKELTLDKAAMHIVIQGKDTAIKVARHHLKHQRYEAADKVLREAEGA